MEGSVDVSKDPHAYVVHSLLLMISVSPSFIVSLFSVTDKIYMVSYSDLASLGSTPCDQISCNHRDNHACRLSSKSFPKCSVYLPLLKEAVTEVAKVFTKGHRVRKK